MSDWPLVDLNDDGIRPAGMPDQCFYCHQKIGQPHGLECVIVTKEVRVRVTLEYPIRVPHFWREEDINFHRNESSWCTSNALSEIDAYSESKGCLCGEMKTEFVKVTDNMPTRELNADDAPPLGDGGLRELLSGARQNIADGDFNFADTAIMAALERLGVAPTHPPEPTNIAALGRPAQTQGVMASVKLCTCEIITSGQMADDPACPFHHPPASDCVQVYADGNLISDVPSTPAPKRWLCSMTCCGRADGCMIFDAWNEAETFRESYTSGVAVAWHGYSAGPHESGHKRSVVISEWRGDGKSGIWQAAPPAPDRVQVYADGKLISDAPSTQLWTCTNCGMEVRDADVIPHGDLSDIGLWHRNADGIWCGPVKPGRE